MKKMLAAAGLVSLLAGCGGTGGATAPAFTEATLPTTAQSAMSQPSGALPTKECLKVFYDLMDTSNNGHISKTEFIDGPFGYFFPHVRMHVEMDANKDASLSLEEWVTDYEKQYGMQRAYFVASDGNDDQRLTFNEMMRNPMLERFPWGKGEKEKFVSGIMKSYDKDGSTALSFKEYQPLMRWSVGCFVAKPQPEMTLNLDGQKQVQVVK